MERSTRPKEKHGTREIRLHGLKSEAGELTRPMAKR